MKFCPNCGTPCEGANFCPGCGKDLRPYQQTMTQVKSSTQPQATVGQVKTTPQYDVETALAPFSYSSRGNHTYMITGVKDKNITKVVIPDCVTQLGSKAFFACPQLEEVYLPASLEGTGYLAFGKCESLRRVVIATGVKYIEEGSFGMCKKLEEIQIPEGVLSIGMRAFQGSGLKHIQLPKTLQEIGDNAFADCVNLTSAKVPYRLVEQFQAQCDPTCTIIPY